MSLPLGHIILIPSQPVFVLSDYCCVVSGEATNTNFIIFGLIRSGLEPTIYRTGGEHANHYTTDAVQILENSDSLKDFLKIEYWLLHKAVTQIIVHKKHNETIFF